MKVYGGYKIINFEGFTLGADEKQPGIFNHIQTAKAPTIIANLNLSDKEKVIPVSEQYAVTYLNGKDYCFTVTSSDGKQIKIIVSPDDTIKILGGRK